MQSRDSLSNERPLSGVELAVATVAQWPNQDTQTASHTLPPTGYRPSQNHQFQDQFPRLERYLMF